MTEEEIIRGCLKNDRSSQRALFEMFSANMTDVCMRYARDRQDAKEVLLNGFKAIYSDIRNYAEKEGKRKGDTPTISLSDWVKSKVINAVIRHMHQNKKQHFVSSTVSIRDAEKPVAEEVPEEKIILSANKQVIIKALQQLTPSYRVIYNMHEIDGYTHLEISKLLDISEYLSKDSLSKAKFNLRKNLVKMLANK